MALVAAPPAGALAASGGSVPGETATESPGSTTEPASPPASTGWTPTGTATGASSDGATSIRRGSSLGSGGGSKQTGATGEEKVGASGGEPSNTAGSGGYHEPESSTASTFEGPASAPQVRSTPHTGGASDSVARPATAPPSATSAKTSKAAVGTATPVALPESPQGHTVSSTPGTETASLTDPRDQTTSGFGALPLLVVIVLGLILVFVVGRLGLHSWRRHDERQRLEVRSRREAQWAQWEATLRQIQLKQASETTNPSNEQGNELGSDFAPMKVRAGTATAQDRADRVPAQAR